MKTKELTFEERREAEIDKIQELYKFPIAFIEMYQISINVKDEWLTFRDGVSYMSLNMTDFRIIEDAKTWNLQRGISATLELHKLTRQINTFML